MAYGDRKAIRALTYIAGLKDDPTAQTAPVLSLDQRVEIVMGQGYPRLADGQQWPMSNNALYYFSRALDTRLSLVEQAVATQQQITSLLVASFGATTSEVTTLRASVELVRAAGLATQSQLEANAAGDVQLALRVHATEQQLAADQLADVARDAHERNQDAQLEALRLRAVAGEAASAEIKAAAQAAETKAATALASATQAIADATTAQRLASQAKVAADAAQKTADVATTQAAANTASLVTVAADVAKKLPADAVHRFVVATPAVTIQVGTPATFSVPLPKAFTDNQYLCFFTNASGSTLLNVRLGDTAKLPGSFTATMQQTGLVQLAVQASSAEVLVIRLAN